MPRALRIWTVCAFVAALCLRSSLPAVAQPAERPAPEMFIKRGVFAEGRLWLLSDTGTLFSVDEQAGTSAREELPEPAGDICLWRGRPTILTGAADAGQWTMRRRDGGQWSVIATLPRARDSLVGIDCTEAAVTVLTDRRIIALGETRRERRLSGRLEGGRVTTTLLATPDHLFVGLNAGEWGGGLRRVERRTGRLATIERNISGELCDGPLNTGCDPVNGLAVSPWRPGCVVAAIGLVHFMPRGRLAEICGERVERLYFRPLESGWGDNSRLGADGEPFSTVAFFGLIRSGDTLWAAGIDGLYEVRGPDAVARRPLPTFRQVGDFRLSFEVPGIVLVVTSVHRRASVSAGAPLIVPR